MNVYNINKRLDIINDKLKQIDKDIKKDRITIDAHPIIFLLIILVFFITIEFWTTGAVSLLKYIHPRNKVYFWEYIIAGIFCLIFLFWLGKLFKIDVSYLLESQK